ncbi:MAG TPA: LpxD N-terminal domain-containing protein, partial [Silvibacterium sp.]|nr:LpxD N-terminal domain-containing protein [Silvibacterium sp.]
MRLVQLAELLEARLRGGALGKAQELEVSGVGSAKNATAETVVFAEDAAALTEAMKSEAAAVIVAEQMGSDVDFVKPLLIVKHAKLAFARTAQLLRSPDTQAGIHPTAVIDGSVVMGRRVSVGAYAVIEAGAKIGDGSAIGVGAVVGRGVAMGRECQIYPRVVLYPGVDLGDRVIVHAGAVLGSDGFGYVRDQATGEYVQFPQQGRLI